MGPPVHKNTSVSSSLYFRLWPITGLRKGAVVPIGSETKRAEIEAGLIKRRTKPRLMDSFGGRIRVEAFLLPQDVLVFLRCSAPNSVIVGERRVMCPPSSGAGL